MKSDSIQMIAKTAAVNIVLDLDGAERADLHQVYDQVVSDPLCLEDYSRIPEFGPLSDTNIVVVLSDIKHEVESAIEAAFRS